MLFPKNINLSSLISKIAIDLKKKAHGESSLIRVSRKGWKKAQKTRHGNEVIHASGLKQYMRQLLNANNINAQTSIEASCEDSVLGHIPQFSKISLIDP